MRVLDKLRAYRKEYKFTRAVAARFFEMFKSWRRENPDDNYVYIYVGAPEMAETMIRRSPLWQRFEAFERSAVPYFGHNYTVEPQDKKYDA